MKKKEKVSNDHPNKNVIKNFFETIGEQHGFGLFNIQYNWIYHCGLNESEVRVVHYILNFTLNGRPCLSRKEVLAFTLNLHVKTVERAIATLREKEIVWGTKKANPMKDGKYTGSHIEGGYVVSGKRLKVLFHENFQPELQPQRQDERKESTQRLLEEMYKEDAPGSSSKALDHEESIDPVENADDGIEEATKAVLEKEPEETENKNQKFQFRNMTAKEEEVFGSSKAVEVNNSASGEKFEFLNPMRAYFGMQKYIKHDEYSPTSVTLQLMGGDVDIHGQWEFKLARAEDF